MSGIVGVDLTDRYVVIKEAAHKSEYRDLTWRVFLAQGGFGCDPGAIGSAVIGEYVRDGETVRKERFEIERLATDAEVEAARAAGQAATS